MVLAAAVVKFGRFHYHNDLRGVSIALKPKLQFSANEIVLLSNIPSKL